MALTLSELAPDGIVGLLRGFLLGPDQRHALIVGDAGLGKTSLLRFLAHSLRTQEGLFVQYVSLREVETAERLPAFVSRQLLRALQSVQDRSVPSFKLAALREFSSQLVEHQQSDAPEILGRLLELLVQALGPTRRAILMLDGLDVTRDPGRIVLLIERTARRHQSSVRLVLASRPLPEVARLQQNPTFETFLLGGLNIGDARQLLERVAGRRLPLDVLKAILALAGGNPQMLTMLGAVALETWDLAAIATSPDALLARVSRSILNSVSEFSGDLKETRRLLFLIAVLQPVSISYLANSSVLENDRVRSIVEAAVKSGIVLLDGSDLVSAHGALGEQVLQSYVLSDIIDLAKLQFGSEAAEQDGLFASSFMPPPDLKSIVCGEKTIVLGDRGAGKSAVFRSLDSASAREVFDGDEPISKVIIAAAQQPANLLLQLTADASPVSSAERFKALWLLYVAALAAREIHGLASDSSVASRRYVREARSILRRIGWAHMVQGEGRFSRFIAAARSLLPERVSFGVGPVTVEPYWSRSGGGLGSGSQVQIVDFLERTDEILQAIDRHLLVVFDQIDEAYKYQRDVQESLVQGLFLAEAYLSQRRRIRLAVLLRTDLFEIYDIQEKNKFVSRTVRLSWSWPDLTRQLLKRAYANKPLEGVCELLQLFSFEERTAMELKLRIMFPAEVEGVSFSQWLFEGLRNGNGRVAPRQIILFLNLARESGRLLRRTKRIPLFSEKDVADALTQLSEHSFQEVLSDFRVATAFVRSCRAGKIGSFELSEVEGLFNLQEGSVALQVERLERLGFLERLVVREGDEVVSRFRIPALFTRCWESSSQ